MRTVVDRNLVLRQARDKIGYSLERVARSPVMDPPIAARSIERWELGQVSIKIWRVVQLAEIYRLDPDLLLEQLESNGAH